MLLLQIRNQCGDICFDCRSKFIGLEHAMMDHQQGEPLAFNGASASTVQIAFDANPIPHHCGYCNTDGSCSAGLSPYDRASSVSVRRIRSSNCGYCHLEKGKISLGKRPFWHTRGTCFLIVARHCGVEDARGRLSSTDGSWVEKVKLSSNRGH